MSFIQGILLATQLLSFALVAIAQSLNASNIAPGPFPTGDDQIQLSPPQGYSGSSTAPLSRFNLVNLTSTAVSKLSVSISMFLVLERTALRSSDTDY
jgi:hypothetical protein